MPLQSPTGNQQGMTYKVSQVVDLPEQDIMFDIRVKFSASGSQCSEVLRLHLEEDMMQNLTGNLQESRHGDRSD